jgi:hypothetical protein
MDHAHVHMVGAELRAIFLVLVVLMLPAAFTASVASTDCASVTEDGQG